MKTLTVKEFQEQLKAQGVGSREHFAFRCPICATLQSGHDLIKVGAGKTFEKVEPFIGFACIGRWTKAGPHKQNAPSGKGCDWTLGGLLQVHTLEVIDDENYHHPRFEIATPEDAQAHKLRQS